MPEIRTVQYVDRKIAVIEDPNPTYSRIFIDTIQHDLTTLTPSWTKQWHYNAQGMQWSATGNTANYYMNSFGPGQGIQRALNGINGVWTNEANIASPVVDDGFFRAGIMHLQGGTISTYAVGDSTQTGAYTNGSFTTSGNKHYANFQVDTYHQSLQYQFYPTTKLALVANGTYVLALMPGDRGLGGRTDSSTFFYNANDGWFLYGSDITNSIGPNGGAGAIYNIPSTGAFVNGVTNPAASPMSTIPWTGSSARNPATTAITTNQGSYYNMAVGTSGVGFTSLFGSTIAWEDAGNGFVYLINTSNPSRPFVIRVGSYTTNNPTWNIVLGTAASSIVHPATSAGSTANSNSRIFFAGVDNFANTIWVTCNDHPTLVSSGAGGVGITVQRVAANLFITNTSYQMTTQNANTTFAGSNQERVRRLAPSNIRRDSANNNRLVFYTPHYDAGTATNPNNFPPNNGVFGNANLVPLRWTIDISTGNVLATMCNVAYPGSNGHQQYAAPMSLNQTSWTYDTTTSSGTWGVKPQQFTCNGNTYITFWLTDQMALSNPGGGQYRWPTPNTRTMMTYQTSGTSGTNDWQLTFHSAYTFYTLADIPKNFMPVTSSSLSANTPLVVVPQTYKTSFFKFVDYAAGVPVGWYPAQVYNTEFRTLGQDSTGRMWGYAMDKNNGNIHIVTPSLPVNVSVVMANTNFTYTGTSISTSAIVNAYDWAGNRLAANVQLTIDGSTMLFATNSSKSYTLATSNTGDTTVALNINGGGINNIYAAISV